jgi:hypothetical protein
VVKRPPDTGPVATSTAPVTSVSGPTADGTAGVRKPAADRQPCAHRRIWWDLVGSERVVEATALLGRDQDVATVDLGVLAHLGGEARHVLDGQGATWQIVEWSLPIIRMVWRDLPVRPTWRGVRPLVDVALGGALVAIRTAFPDPPACPGDDADGAARDLDEQLRGTVVRGATVALRHLAEDAAHDLRLAAALLSGGG